MHVKQKCNAEQIRAGLDKLDRTYSFLRYDLPEESEDEISKGGFCCQSFPVKLNFTKRFH